MNDEKRPVLLCLDLEAGSETLAVIGAGFAKDLGEDLRILYVMPEKSRESEEDALGRLGGLIEKTLGGLDIMKTLEVRRGEVEGSIVEYMKEKGARIVILGHRHGARRERVYVGSTTRAIISLAPAPVLVVPIDSEKGSS